jgi:SNF2 family DNA or RNA helicase
MGSGKTSATLAAIDILNLLGMKKVLVIAPPLVAESVWPEEVKKFEDFRHLTIKAVRGSPTERAGIIKRDYDIYTISYELTPWLLEHPDCPAFDMMVIDEASKLRGWRGSFQKHPKTGKAYLRRGGTRRAAAIAVTSMRNYSNGRFIELTGTQSPKGLQNLWPQMWFIDKGARLGNCFSAFEHRWFGRGYNGFDLEPKENAYGEITELCSQNTLVITPKNIEKPIVRDIYVNLPHEVRGIYQAAFKKGVADLGDTKITAVNAGARFNKCSQIANGAVYENKVEGDESPATWQALHDVKLQALESIKSEYDGSPLLVVYHYAHDLVRLKKAFPEGVALDGKAPNIKKWNEGKIPMMFLHPASAGHGNNFQHGGHIIVFFALDWDLELYEQVIERIGPARQRASGYIRPVYVYRILCRDTVDELKAERMDTKAAIQDLIKRMVRDSSKSESAF